MNQKQIPGTYALKGGTQAWKSAGYPMEGAAAAPAQAQPAQNPGAIGPVDTPKTN